MLGINNKRLYRTSRIVGQRGDGGFGAETTVGSIIRPWWGKGKVLPRTGNEGPEGSRGIARSLTLALDEGGWSTSRPGRFTPGKETRYPLYRRLGGPQGRSGRIQKIPSPPGFDPRTVQPVASHYTDWAIPAHPTHPVLTRYITGK
jgi:hypothetical protein